MLILFLTLDLYNQYTLYAYRNKMATKQSYK